MVPAPDLLFTAFGPPLANPLAGAVEDLNRLWARRVHLVRIATAGHRFDESLFGILAAHTTPHADMAGLQLCAAWISWLFQLDDQHAEGAHGSPAAWTRATGAIGQVLLAGDGRRWQPVEGPLLRVLASLMQRISAIASAE